jgi:hypothetical protein
MFSLLKSQRYVTQYLYEYESKWRELAAGGNLADGGGTNQF